MDAVAMNAEAARCFRRACESENPLDQTIYISLRQAWLGLAHQTERRAMRRPQLVVSDVAANPTGGARQAAWSNTAKRSKSGSARKPSRTRRRKLAA